MPVFPQKPYQGSVLESPNTEKAQLRKIPVRMNPLLKILDLVLTLLRPGQNFFPHQLYNIDIFSLTFFNIHKYKYIKL